MFTLNASETFQIDPQPRRIHLGGNIVTGHRYPFLHVDGAYGLGWPSGLYPDQARLAVVNVRTGSRCESPWRGD